MSDLPPRYNLTRTIHMSRLATKLRARSALVGTYFEAARMMALAEAAHWLAGGDREAAREALTEAAEWRRRMRRRVVA